MGLVEIERLPPKLARLTYECHSTPQERRRDILKSRERPGTLSPGPPCAGLFFCTIKEDLTGRLQCTKNFATAQSACLT